MTWGSEYLNELRGKLRAEFSEQMRAKGVAYARSAKAAEQARRVHDRGSELKQRAASIYEKYRTKWVLREYRKLQRDSSGKTPELKPAWANSGDSLMKQAEENVFDRHHNRLLKIDATTRREIARVRRENAPARSRTR